MTLNIYFRILLLVLLGQALLSAQSTYWSRVNPPFSGKVTAIGLDKVHGLIYIANNEGNILRSSNDGDTWTSLSTVRGSIASLLVKNAFGIFAATSHSGIYGSTNGGISWSWIEISPPLTNVTSIYSDPNGVLYVCDLDGQGIYRSTNNGQNWIQSNDGLPNGYVYDVVADSKGNLFAGMYGGYLARSTNGGKNWKQVLSGVSYSTCFSLYVDSHDNVYAAMSGIIRISTDGGSTWIDTGLMNRNGGNVNSVTVNEITGTIIAGDWGGGVFRSTDFGRTWLPTGLPYSYMEMHAMVSDSRGKIFCSSRGSGIYRSSDDGISWAGVNQGLGASTITCVTSDAKGDLLCGTAGNGIHVSADFGSTWRKIGVGAGTVSSIAIGPSDHIYALCAQLPRGWGGTTDLGTCLQSSDLGNTWDLFVSGGGQTNSLTCDQQGSAYVSSNNGLLYSSNNGTSWNWDNSFLDGTDVYFTLSDGFGNLYSTTQKGFARSANRGVTWSFPGYIGNATVKSRVLVKNRAGRILAGSDHGIFVSDNSGNTWVQSNNGLANTVITDLAISPMGYLFVATATGVFESADNGSSWYKKRTDGLTDSTISSVFVSAAGYLFCVTPNGAYRSLHDATLDAVVLGPKTLAGDFLVLQNYPNPFNPSTTIGYSLPRAAIVSLRIFNTLGQEVAVLVNEQKEPGYYQATWSAANVPSGIYFYRLQAGEFVETKKMILMK